MSRIANQGDFLEAIAKTGAKLHDLYLVQSQVSPQQIAATAKTFGLTTTGALGCPIADSIRTQLPGQPELKLNDIILLVRGWEIHEGLMAAAAA